MRRGAGLAVLLAVALMVALAVSIVSHRHGGRPDDQGATGPFCSTTVDGRLVELSVGQAENAALITSIAVRRGLPARAASIALATAYQESDLLNLRYGDRDSLGLFQQRPSQGWGTRREILDPAHATNAFYDALQRVGDYQTIDITVAAQEVQRSAYPSAYAYHEADARALASALTGNSPGAFTCHLPGRGRIGSSVQARDRAISAFGADARLASPSGVDVTVTGRTHKWAVASYFVAYADSLGLRGVSYDGRTWTRAEGWTSTPEIGRHAVHLDPTR